MAVEANICVLRIPRRAARYRVETEFAGGVVGALGEGGDAAGEFVPARPAAVGAGLGGVEGDHVVRGREPGDEEEILELTEPGGACFGRLALGRDAPDSHLASLGAKWSVGSHGGRG